MDEKEHWHGADQCGGGAAGAEGPDVSMWMDDGCEERTDTLKMLALVVLGDGYFRAVMGRRSAQRADGSLVSCMRIGCPPLTGNVGCRSAQRRHRRC